ncbi:leaf rust 10 disease-resistance locus receptor-like protein kinase-like 2.7 protein [Tanacetum coccineum]
METTTQFFTKLITGPVDNKFPSSSVHAVVDNDDLLIEILHRFYSMRNESSGWPDSVLMALYIHFPKAGWLNPIFGVLFWEKEIEEDSFMVLKLDKKVIEYKIRYDLRILGPEHEGLHVVTYKSTTLLVLMKVVVAPTIETSSLALKNLGESQAYNTPPEYGIRIDFDIPVTTRCLQCQDGSKGGGTCGYDVETHDFSCLCDKGNVTTYCKGTATAVSVAGAIGIGVGVWYFRKARAKAPVTHGVQSNENRLF